MILLLSQDYVTSSGSSLAEESVALINKNLSRMPGITAASVLDPRTVRLVIDPSVFRSNDKEKSLSPYRGLAALSLEVKKR